MYNKHSYFSVSMVIRVFIVLLLLGSIAFIIIMSDSPGEIVFNTVGGENLGNIKIEDDIKLTQVIPQKQGYVFEGWYGSPNLDGEPLTEVNKTARTVVLYAKWSIAEYTISFNSNGGTSVEPITQEFETDVLAPLQPTKYQCQFGGWYSDVELTQQYTFTKITGDITLYAKWIPNTYTITFESNGGSNIASITKEYNTSLSAPQPPQKLGYSFGGWFTEQELANGYQFIRMEDKDITLYAKWNIKQYTITFVSNGGNSISSLSLDYNQDIPVLSQPIKIENEFIGWYIDSALTQPYNLTKMPANNTVLYAKWSINQYLIHFDSKGGSAIDSVSLDYNAYIPVFSVPTKIGFNFAGWYNDEELTSSFNLTKMPEQDITIYAKWAIRNNTIAYETNGGSTIDAISQGYGTALNEPAPPEKAGYNFSGWYNDRDLTQAFVFGVMPANSLIIYAKWLPKTYTISFDSKGGSSIDSIVQEYSSIINEPVSPLRTGYTFNGWYRDIQLTKAFTFNTMPASNSMLHAKWTIRQYTITFNCAGGEDIDNITMDYGKAVNPPSNPERPGYIFDGWFTDESYSQNYIFTTIPAENIVLHAKWILKQYTIVYETNGGSEITSITLDYGTEINSPLEPTKTGHDFIGWYSDEAMTIEFVFATMPGRNTTVYAKWQKFRFNIFFESNGGSEVPTINQAFGTAVNSPDTPVKEGYSFGGWFSEEELINEYEFTVMLSEDTTAYAKWNINQYSIIFNSNGGNVIDIITGDFGIAINQPTSPEKTGHTFDGWFVDEQLSEEFIFDTMPASNLVLNAKWQINQYIISFNTDGGSISNDIVADFGTVVNEPVEPTKAGYSFEGWLTDGTFATPYIFSVMPSEDLTVYAKWSIKDFLISFVTFGGTSVAAISQPYGSAVIAPEEIPIKNGYDFVGWYNDEACTTEYIFTTMPAENTVAYAKWQEKVFTITFESNGGSAVNPINALFGESISAPAIPTKDGFSFAGWFTDEGLTSSYVFVTMQANSFTLYAKWVVGQSTISFVSNGGSGVTSITGAYGIDITQPNDPTRENYRFDGWYTDNETFVNEFIFNTMPANDTILYAKWVEQIIVTFDTDGATAIEDALIDINTKIMLPADPVKEYYSFEGWFVDVEFSAPFDFDTTIMTSTTIYAMFTPIEYTITYYLDGGTEETNPVSYTIETATFSLASPAKDYYAFGGWYSDVELATPAVTTITQGSNGDLNFYAKFSPIEYTITYYLDGGIEETNPTTYTVETATFNLADPTKDYYTFGGWYSDIGLTTPAVTTITQGSNGNLDFYAMFSPIEYTITYYLDGGIEETNPITYTFETETFTLIGPTKDYYTFGGWYSDIGLTTPAVTTIAQGSNGDLDFYAKFTPIEYTITYYLDGGREETNPTTYTVETETFTLADPTKDGYSFEGWFENVELTTLADTTITQGSNGALSFYAEWELSEATITFVSNGGAVIAPLTASIGDIITEPAQPTREGYDFDAWYTDDGIFENAYIFDTMPSADITLYANWTLKVCTISFVSNDGTSVDDIIQDYGTIIAEPADPTKPGYYFDAWYTDDGTFLNEFIFDTMPEDTTLYAKWIPIPYNIIYFINNGGTNHVDNPDTYTIVDSITILDPTPFYGYEFVGWFEANLTTPAVTEINGGTGVLEFYAVWIDTLITVSFDTKGGSYLEPVRVEEGTTITKTSIATPTKNSYAFDNWYADSGLTTLFNFSNAITQNVTMYARWVTAVGYFTYAEHSTYVHITGLVPGYPQQIIVPNTINSKPVTHILDYALEYKTGMTYFESNSNLRYIGNYTFRNCTGLRDIVIAEGVTEIKQQAFEGCVNLLTATLPKTITNMGNEIFKNCRSLQTLTLPYIGQYKDSMQYYGVLGYHFNMGTSGTGMQEVVQIYPNGFATYYIPASLRTVTITNEVEVPDGAFYGCSMITNIYIEQATSIARNAFYNCSNLRILVIPNMVTSIGQNILYGAIMLDDLTLPMVAASTTSHSSSAGVLGYFFGNNNNSYTYLARQYYSASYVDNYIPKSLKTLRIKGNGTYIGYGSVSACTYIRSVFIENVSSIGVNAFREIHDLVGVYMDNSVTSIGNVAFTQCSNLTTINLPSSITYIGISAFEDCGLTRVYSYATTPPYLGQNAFNGNPSNIMIYAPSGSVTAYRTTDYWTSYSSRIYSM